MSYPPTSRPQGNGLDALATTSSHTSHFSLPGQQPLEAGGKGQQGEYVVLAPLQKIMAPCFCRVELSGRPGARWEGWVAGNLGQGPGQGLLVGEGSTGPLPRPIAEPAAGLGPAAKGQSGLWSGAGQRVAQKQTLGPGLCTLLSSSVASTNLAMSTLCSHRASMGSYSRARSCILNSWSIQSDASLQVKSIACSASLWVMFSAHHLFWWAMSSAYHFSKPVLCGCHQLVQEEGLVLGPPPVELPHL